MRRLNKAYFTGLLVAGACAVLLAGCKDESDQLVIDPSYAKACSPGHVKSGKCVEPPDPPTGPVEPNLPDPAPFDGMLSPLRMVAAPGDHLLVTDARLHLLLRVDPTTGQADQALTLNGKPSGVGISENRIFVADKTHRKADAFAADGGAFLFSFGLAELLEPSDLVVDAGAGLVFVSDSQAGRILVFDLDGGFVSAIGTKGVLPNELYAPMGVAVDTVANEIFVTDWGDFGDGDIESPPSVKIFGYDGAHIATISGEGECNWFSGLCTGGFSRPSGIFVANGKIYFADLQLAQVLVYDRFGLGQITTIGDRPQLRLPSDVEVLNGSDLFAVSSGTATVEEFPGGAQ